MASFYLKISLLICFLAASANPWMAKAGDPDITSDFLVPENVTKVDGNFFTFTGFREVFGTKNITNFKVTSAAKANFPVLDGQSLSFTIFQFPVGTFTPPHTHPRASELLFVVDGSLEVGFVDTTNKLFSQTLQRGDLFVFPKGLVHFVYNAVAGRSNPSSAVAIGTFASSNPGTILLPSTLFGSSHIDDEFLSKSFMVDIATIKKLRAGFGC